MKSKNLKLYIIFIGIIAVYSGCSRKENTIDLLPVQTVEKMIESDYTEVKNGYYNNLIIDDFLVMFPKGKDQIYELMIQPKRLQVTGGALISLVKEQIGVAKGYLGDGIRDSDFEIELFEGNESERYQYSEVLSGESENKYLGMVLYDKMEEDEKYMQFNPEYSLVWMSAGGLKERGNSSVSVIMAATQGQADYVRVYYRNSADGSLEDTYNLADGEYSIREGISFVEDYMNNKMPYPVDSSAPKRVDRVYVLSLGNNRFAYYFTLRKSFDGIMFDTWLEGRMYQEGSPESYTVYDSAGVAVFEKNSVDFFYGYINNQIIQRTDKAIDKIISLKDAFGLVSDHLEGEGNYIIKSTEFSYRSKYVNEEEEKERAYPVWKFEAEKGTNMIKLYVNAVSGAVECVTLKE